MSSAVAGSASGTGQWISVQCGRMAQQRTGGTAHAAALVVRDERRVADQVYQVEPLRAVQDQVRAVEVIMRGGRCGLSTYAGRQEWRKAVLPMASSSVPKRRQSQSRRVAGERAAKQPRWRVRGRTCKD